MAPNDFGNGNSGALFSDSVLKHSMKIEPSMRNEDFHKPGAN